MTPTVNSTVVDRSRRRFVQSLAALGGSVLWRPSGAAGTDGAFDRLLILVELKGGNDGLNTVVPFADREYLRLRPRLAIGRDRVLPLDERTGLHPSLGPLLPLWQQRELAIVQGVGYPDPNLSHFRSIEIWDTASAADETLDAGWLTRVFAAHAPPREFVADGIVVGSAEGGPLEGTGGRVIRLNDTAQFLRQARLALPEGLASNAALRHILEVDRNVAHAARGLDAGGRLATTFPNGAFGNAVRTACQAIASPGGVAALKLSLGGFDTHVNQAGRHEALLRELASGLVALRAGLMEVGAWQRTLVMTYSEFGRRPRENDGGGTDHGTAAPHLVLGGRVRGGLFGAPPRLDRLDGNGNLAFAVDFRALFATVIERWWALESRSVLGGAFTPLPIV